jgi:glycosyltransferase involved in cell wall biosynthesis
MNICILSKFPPLEGGISAKTYWLARAYAQAGHNVHVVSNANMADKAYIIPGCYPHIQQLEGVTLHEVEPDSPWHIPNEPHSLARLVDTALRVAEQHELNVIDTGYMVPYGMAGFLLHKITGLPYVLRHGGSDIEKFLIPGGYSRLLTETIANADKVHLALFEGRCRRVTILPPYVPNPDFFFPVKKRAKNRLKLLFLGKINWHWERKGLDLISRFIKIMPKDWEIQWIGQGNGKTRFRQFLKEEGITGIQIHRFVAPWEVPSIVQNSDFVFCLQIAEPIKSFSNLITEALACGTVPIVTNDFDTALYTDVFRKIDTSVVRFNASDVAAIVDSVPTGHQEISNRDETLSFFHRQYIEENLRELESIA